MNTVKPKVSCPLQLGTEYEFKNIPLNSEIVEYLIITLK